MQSQLSYGILRDGAGMAKVVEIGNRVRGTSTMKFAEQKFRLAFEGATAPGSQNFIMSKLMRGEATPPDFRLPTAQ